MSIFSTDIIEDPWVGMAYSFWNCTNPTYKDTVWRDAFKINFSKNKLRDAVKKMLLRDDGGMRLGEVDFDDMNNTLESHGIHKLNDEYKFIILICLLVPSLNENNLSSLLTSCLKQTQLRSGSDVIVKVKFPEKDKQHTFIIIHVLTTTPQWIEITLRRK